MRYFIFVFLSCVFCTAQVPADQVSRRVEVDQLAKTTLDWTGTALPAYPEGQPEVTLLKITIPPRARLPWHTHPVINCGYLLEGELVITTEDGEVLHLQAGDPIVEVVDRLHYGRNPGNAPAVILVFYAGIENKPVTVLEKPEGEATD